MTSQAERTSPLDPVKPSPVTDDRDAFAEMFDAHAQHLFDYCCSLAGDRARAASATQVTLIAVHSLAGRLHDSGRMRPFVLALGRWECLSGEQHPAVKPAPVKPPGTDDLAAALAFVDQADDDIVDADPGELTLSDFETSSGLSLRAVLDALPRDDREILELLYRHDVTIPELAPLLGVPPASVPGMLAAAKAKFTAKASERAGAAAPGQARPDVGAEQLSAVRLLALPGSVWRRTARVVMDPRFRSYREAVSAHAQHLGPDGFPVQPTATPSSRKLLMASALMAGLLLAPAAAGGVVYGAVSTLAHVVDHRHSAAVTPGGPTSGGSAAGGAAGAGRHAEGGAKRSRSKATGNAGAGPTAQRRESASPPHHKRSPSPKPTSRYSSSSSPWPSQTPTSPGSPTTSPSSPSPSPTPSSSATTAAAAATPTSGPA